MTVEYSVLLGSYGLATVVGAILAVVVWQHRQKTGAVPLAVSLFGTVIVSASRFVGTAVDSYSVSVFVERTLYVGIGLSVLAIVVFALVYTGREQYVTPQTIGVLSIEPLLVVVLVATNPGNVFFESIDPDPTLATGVAVEWGVAFGIHTLYSYLLLAGTTVLILEFLFTSRALFRGQALALLGGTMLPWLANAVHVVGPVSADTTPIGYVLMGGLYAFAIVRYRLTDVVPIARNQVLDTVTEGIFVVDRNDRVVDVNRAGQDMIDVYDGDSVIGVDVETILADVPTLLEQFRELTASQESRRAELSFDDSYYEARASPIVDDRENHVGWLVLVSEITERKRREQELQRHNDRLEQFASIVSHDLRNPLNVASGYVDLARETGDPQHLDEIEQSHERMETIIDDVLELARTGDPVTETEPVSIGDLATQAWDGVDTGEAVLTIDTDVRIRSDPGRTIRLLENMFRNSIEHGTDEDDLASLEVTIGSIGEPDRGSLEGIYVADDGVGIPVEDRDQIFEGGYTTGSDGVGLGLSIVEQIAAAHGWSIDVTDSEAGGARFEFTGLEFVSDQPRTTTSA